MRILLISDFFDSYKRWRHSKGYGVHSPYAFRMVKDVVRPGNYGYYGYDLIDAVLGSKNSSPELKLKELRLLLRLLVFLHSKRLLAIGPLTQGMLAVAHGAGVEAETFRQSSDLQKDDLVIISNIKTTSEALKKSLGDKTPIIAISPSPEIRNFMMQPLSHGLLLTGSDIMILIPRPEMHYVSYSMKF